jgi:hypothetical protein
MNKSSNLGVVVGIVLSICLSLVAIIKVNTPVYIPQTIDQQGQPISVGGTSPEISSPYLKINDVMRWFQALPLGNNTSSTICSIKSPSATSSLIHSGIGFVSGATTGTFGAYKSATISATTTFLYGGNLTTGTQSVFNATTTSDSWVFEPDTYLVFDMTAGFAPTGTCQAEFSQLK